MKLKIAMCTALLISGQAFAEQVRVDKVQPCTNDTLLLPCNGETQEEYIEWEEHEVSNSNQKNTYIARYSTPNILDIEHFVFLAHGQRPSFLRRHSYISGAIADFEDAFEFDGVLDRDNGVSSYEFEPLEGSLPGRLFSEGFFDKSNTFMASAWDARYDHDTDADERKKIANAYYAWMKRQFISSNLKSIYLGGQSRGGALLTEMAKRFKRDLPNVPLFVHTFDAVADPGSGENELGTHRGNKIYNPKIKDFEFFTYEANFDEIYPNRNLLRHYLQIGGLPFVGQAIEGLSHDVRSFAYVERNSQGEIPAEVPVEIDNEWLRQKWYVHSHPWFAVEPHAVNSAIEELHNTYDDLLAKAVTFKKPVAKCSSTFLSSGNSVVSGEFHDNGSYSQTDTPLEYSWTFNTGSSSHSSLYTQQLASDGSSMRATATGTTSKALYGVLLVTDGYENKDTATCTVYAPVSSSTTCTNPYFCQ